ncbi:baseplate J/gp47 family protein [Longirhabdus pacifica]|uniref:baseplate J/gp47 family protein n=1 Tax=Longirhabdus pacifica TaxID=2305227 RepID=UPI0010091A88|nr:baseplate J/gp47 family protein [Longirhabdus pacifica]
MAFEHKTKEEILSHMLMKASEEQDIDTSQGSIVYDLLSPAALELAEAYVAMDRVLKLGFADSTYGSFLDKRCNEMGVYRKQAQKASGEVTFTGKVKDTKILQGTKVGTKEDIYFVVTEDGKLEDEIMIDNIKHYQTTLSVQADEEGTSGNIQAGQITEINDVNGITVSNSKDFYGGLEEEKDESLLQRYLEVVRRPAATGNKYDYIKWAKEVSGVKDAKVLPITPDPGKVKVVLLGEGNKKPDALTIQKANQMIQAERPVGAYVEVVGVEEKEIKIEVEIERTLQANTAIDEDALKEKLVSVISEYLSTLAFSSSVIRYAHIAKFILDMEEVKDYRNLKINDDMINIQIADTEVATLKTNNITITFVEGS